VKIPKEVEDATTLTIEDRLKLAENAWVKKKRGKG
jgi:hypothetical protein